MCRLFAIASRDPVSPMLAIESLNVMKEGHDGSGVGVCLRGLGGPFAALGDAPILSGIFSPAGLKRLDDYMNAAGFAAGLDLSITPQSPPPDGTPRRGVYLVRAYEMPDAWKELEQTDRELRLVRMRVELREMGLEQGDMTVFSFWPDTIMIKEVGDPLQVGEYLGLQREELKARKILAQGRQNTNYAINLYACHPFFIQGVCSMTNGENTAFVPIREYLSSRDVPGYMGYQSDSEVFTHILHYTLKHLQLPVQAYKHVITPLTSEELEKHPDGAWLGNLKNACRKLVIDGPNCVIACLPDGSMAMFQDRKKLRPGIIGGVDGMYAFSSETCGLDACIPHRDKSKDFQPMHLDTAVVGPECQEVTIWNQNQPLLPLH